ncbi:MAG: hypothetical protein GY754_37465 [bacterium]|nr:hypothetical protein [bacterium]
MFSFKCNEFCGLRSMDVLGLLYGHKKIISTGLSDEYREKLVKTLERYNIYYDTLDESFDVNKKNNTFILSKDRQCIKQAQDAYAVDDFRTIGLLLGYPACCVEWFLDKVFEDVLVPLTFVVREVYLNSKKLLWPLNNVTNFDGRIARVPKEYEDTIPFSFTSLISHVPCSYDCKQSLDIAERNYLLSKKYDRDNFYQLQLLQKPIFYVDDYNFIVFEGNSGENKITYSKVKLHYSLHDLLPFVKEGDELIIEKDTVIVMKNGSAIHTGSYSNPIILSFDNVNR